MKWHHAGFAVFLLGWSQGLVWGCVVEVWSSCGEKRGPQRWGICLELHIKNNSVKLGGGSLFSLPSVLLWLEDWWTRSLSVALPSVTPHLTQGRLFWRTRNRPCTPEMRTEEFLSSCHLCYCVQFPDRRATEGRKGFVLNLQFWVAVHHWGNSRQGFKAGQLAIPHSITSDQEIHSQSKKYSRSYGERYLLAFPKENKGWERRVRGDQEAKLLEFLKDWGPGKDVCYFVYVYTCVQVHTCVLVRYMYTYMYTNVRKSLGIIPQELSDLVVWDRQGFSLAWGSLSKFS